MTDVSTPATAPEPSAPALPPAPGPVSEPRPPSRFGKWLRGALRWTTGLLVVFALGLGATWLAQVRPLQLRLQALDQERQALATQVADLTAGVQEVEAVRSENINLKVAIAKLEQHQLAVRALNATSQAQLVLAGGLASPSVADLLAEADTHLASLEKALAGSMEQEVRGLRDRLALAASEVPSDTFAAQRDLEVLANGIRSLELQLSGG